jgi:hypothetical protein
VFHSKTNLKNENLKVFSKKSRFWGSAETLHNTRICGPYCGNGPFKGFNLRVSTEPILDYFWYRYKFLFMRGRLGSLTNPEIPIIRE